MPPLTQARPKFFKLEVNLEPLPAVAPDLHTAPAQSGNSSEETQWLDKSKSMIPDSIKQSQDNLIRPVKQLEPVPLLRRDKNVQFSSAQIAAKLYSLTAGRKTTRQYLTSPSIG